jgi:hypothetical protein
MKQVLQEKESEALRIFIERIRQKIVNTLPAKINIPLEFEREYQSGQ